MIKDNLSRVRFDRSPFVPQDRPGYFEHLASQAEVSAKKEKKRLEQLEAERGAHHSWIIPFNGQSFLDNRSAVLAIPSMWSMWYEPPQSRPEASWPTLDEFREEGDERHTSGFGRFLPLPRVPGNETVVWKQKAFLEPYILDQVNPVLWREDTPSFLDKEEQKLAETLMKELRGSTSDGQMKREAGVIKPTLATLSPEARECASVSAQTVNSHLEYKTASPLVQGMDGTPKPSPESTSSFRNCQATPKYNATLEFFPAADRRTKREIMSQPLPQKLSCLAASQGFGDEDGIDGDEKLCKKPATNIESLQTEQSRSSVEPPVRGSVSDF